MRACDSLRHSAARFEFLAGVFEPFVEHQDLKQSPFVLPSDQRSWDRNSIVEGYGYRDRCRSRGFWLRSRSLGWSPSDVSVANDFHRPNSRSLRDIPRAPTQVWFNRNVSLGHRSFVNGELKWWVSKFLYFQLSMIYSLAARRLAEHFCVAIAKLANGHLLHRCDPFSDIELHVFLHWITGNRTRGELTAVDDSEHVFGGKLKAIRRGFGTISSLLALR